MFSRIVRREKSEYIFWTAVVILSALFMSVFTQILMGSIYKSHVELMRNRARDKISFLQCAIPHLSPSARQDCLQRISRQLSEISYILVMDIQGKAIAHGDPARVGMNFDDPGFRRCVETGETVEQIYVRDADDPTSPHHGERTIDLIAPYYSSTGQIMGAVNVGLSLEAVTQARERYLVISLLGIALWFSFVMGFAFIHIRIIRMKNRADEARLQSEEMFRALVENSPDVVMRFDREHRHLYVSPAIAGQTGMPPVAFLGKTHRELGFPEELSSFWSQAIDQVFLTGKVYRTEFQLPDGTWLDWLLSPETGPDGTVKAVITSARNISSRKQAEEALRASEEKYRALTETASDVIWTMDLDLNYTYLSPAIMKQTGYSVEDYMALAGQSETVKASFQPIREILARELQLEAEGESDPGRKYTVEGDWVLPNGKVISLERMMSFLRDGQGKIVGIHGISRDITERKKAEAELRRLAAAIEQAGETVVITDIEGKIQYVNPAAERTTGYSRAELIGRNPLFFPGLDRDEPFFQNLRETLEAGKTWEGRVADTRKDGTSFTEEACIAPVFDANGAIMNYVAVTRDVTRETLLEEQLRQSQKMEAVGRLAGGVAHDLNNLLSPIIAYGELLIDGLAPDDRRWQAVNGIFEAGLRARELVRQLLVFGRKQPLDVKPVDLNRTIAAFEKLLRRTIRENIEIRIMLAQGIPAILADAGQIEQIIMNLAVNGQDAMKNGGLLTIETGEAYLDEAYAAEHGGIAPGRYATLAVGDTGPGMDNQTRQRIFEPFFTTKALGEGTGLGLSTVYGIVKQHGGHIEVFTEKGQGAAFRIYFPVAEEVVVETDEAPVSFRDTQGHETIVVAEDNAMVRSLVVQILETDGYKVFDAAGGEDCLRLLAGLNSPVDLLLTDMVMPDMNGTALAEQVVKLFPQVKIVFMSGYTDKDIGHPGLSEDDFDFIQKPFTARTLALKVRELLDSGASQEED